MIVCRTCRIRFEGDAQFCGSCGGFVEFVGVSDEAEAGAVGSLMGGRPGGRVAPGRGPAGSGPEVDADVEPPAGVEPPAPDGEQVAEAVRAADKSDQRAVAEARVAESDEAQARARAAVEAAAEATARAAAAAATDADSRAEAENEADLHAAARARAEAEVGESAKAAEAARRAVAMLARPAPRPTPTPAAAAAARPTPAPAAAPVAVEPIAPAVAVEPMAPGATTAWVLPAPAAAQLMVPCDRCGTDNPANRAFCRKCGARRGMGSQREAPLDQRDYVFDYWTALGWTLLTCGLFGGYVIYQLVRRMRDHNRRRLDLLQTGVAVAWTRVQAEPGLADELRPAFERMGGGLLTLKQLGNQFRDPAVWTVLWVIGGVVTDVVAFVLLDRDLVRHTAAERAVQDDLSRVYARLGKNLPAPRPPEKGQHGYGGRIVATILTLGLYLLWWFHDMMVEPNEHFAEDWAWEDAVRRVAGPL